MRLLGLGCGRPLVGAAATRCGAARPRAASVVVCPRKARRVMALSRFMKKSLASHCPDYTAFSCGGAVWGAYAAVKVSNSNTNTASMKTYCRFLGVAALGLLSTVAVPNSRAESPYKLLKEIPVGGEGGWDYLSVEQEGRRLYVSHATKVVVIDLDKDTVVGEIADTPGVHGIATAPKLGLGFTSNGRENKASVFDLKTLKTTMKVDTGENPDA